ncbi:MAG: diacylglycerol kinase family lipid kinase [Armatimonadota bacterium]|nr:diacylglycerol kinase family lipid kinase [Armatimonadota bacterium]MDR5703283.1 diacylglycerol kinase family lipid kinase [Armatimonadota bacterium]
MEHSLKQESVSPQRATSAVVIVNPIAGGGKGVRLWPTIRDLLHEEGLEFTMVTSEAPLHAIELTLQAVEGGSQLVVAIGGDGTVHEVANGLLRARKEGRGEATLGIIPVGTANDFASALGIPLTVPEATRFLASGHRRDIDAGMVNDRYFVMVAGVGFDAEVVREVNRWRWRASGTIPYLLGVLKTLVGFSPTEVTFVLDGKVHHQRVFLVAIGNSYRYGGGMKICPGAVLDDGLLDVVVAGNIGRLETLALLPRVYLGTHISYRKVQVFRAREVAVTSAARSLAVHADGELVGEIPVTFRILPKTLRVVAPSIAQSPG